MSDPQVSDNVARFTYFPCAKCGAVNPDYLSFGVGTRGRSYCLHHIPRWVRFRMWLRRVE